MAEILANRFRGTGIAGLSADIPKPSTDASRCARLLASCPAHRPTPLVESRELCKRADVGHFAVKDERNRMGLGSFKALGAAYVIACEAEAVGSSRPETALSGRTFVTASAGNHGLSVAAGAKIFGAEAVIYLSELVPEAFAARLAEKGATVVREGEDYEASMAGAARFAEQNGHTLLSDSSWPGYFDLPFRLMEGYLQLAHETVDQVPAPPTHIFLQAGVGGFAGAVAAYFRKAWGNDPSIIVVEPDAAPALKAAIEAGRFVAATGPSSSMGRLDCKEASLIALKGLSADADFFLTISDEEVEGCLPLLKEIGLPTTPSGAAGIAAAICPQETVRDALLINENSRFLSFITEGPE